MRAKMICRAAAGIMLSLSFMASSFAVSASAASKRIKCAVTYTLEYTTVKATAINQGDKIYYTIDGSDPDTSSKQYKKTLGFKAPATLKLAEFDDNGNAVGSVKTMEIECLLPKPKYHVIDRFDGNVEVRIVSAEEGAVIHYTVNGTEPTEKSKVLAPSDALLVKKDCTIKAIAVKEGWHSSEAAVIKPLELVTESSYEDYINRCLEITNEERAKMGLKALKMNKQLCAAAYVRAKELSENYANGHTRPSGKKWTTAMAEQGYIHRYAAENYGKLDRMGVNPEKIMDLWMHSEQHRSDILNEISSDIGIGFYQADGYCYWIQLFGELM